MIENTEISFISAKNFIDKQFGEGYSKAHPELLSAFFHTSQMKECLLLITEAIYECSRDFDCMAANLGGISDNLDKEVLSNSYE